MGGEEKGPEDIGAQLSALPPGTHVKILRRGSREWEGWLLPRDPYAPPESLRLKLASGYNVGLLIREVERFEKLPGVLGGDFSAVPRSDNSTRDTSIPKGAIALLTTGGTIASSIDYATGGVKPVRGTAALDALFPEGAKDIVMREVFDVLSEDIGPTHWEGLAEAVHETFLEGARGIVISHGTDTLAHTASALSFQLRNLPGPVVLVGAQRSIDRPSSDGIQNMHWAVRVAREAELGEVVVVMHAGPSDDVGAIHRGTRVRKMHSTRRDAFRTLNGVRLGVVDDSGVHLNSTHRPRSSAGIVLEKGFDTRGRLVWITPGLGAATAESFCQGARGVIVAATGMGHMPSELVPWVRGLTEQGVFVGITTQCLEGEVDPYVYSRGRELMSAGAVYLEDLAPETAYVKLLWVLGRTQGIRGIREQMLEDMAGEMGDRRPLKGGTS